MEYLAALFGFVVIITIIILVRNGVDWITGTIGGLLTGNNRARGREATQTETHYRVPVPGKEFADRVALTLELSDKPNTDLNGLAIAERSEDGTSLVLEAGNRFQTHLRAILLAEDDENGGGCEGMFTAVEWMESSGHVGTAPTLERIHKHVQAATEHFGGKWSVRASE